ncbi:ASCH domain-containing protein [Rufibacter sp. LB8]|uniref:ASCH domain-containing protein n=1 Tax=Rufibacter sp. LB8 TaxID=2777781 RepID=UPI00178C5195|nr:ASCH domain-containing protein [Rufibacter sp. LB8]
MKVLLSIKPEYADKIFEGEKRYEYRKTLFKNTSITTIIVYASSPVQKVIGEFEIKTILKGDKEELWQRTKKHSGISKCFFDTYFEGKHEANAIEIKCVKKYKQPKCLKDDFNIHFAPQSFLYLHDLG